MLTKEIKDMINIIKHPLPIPPQPTTPPEERAN
jgi:hypothetical protein